MTEPAVAAAVDPASEAAPQEISQVPPRERYFNRELSWLAFNERVLDEACNPAHPLLERVRFLSISGSNLDEFFMVRVAGLKGQLSQDVDRRSVDGMTSSQQLTAIVAEADALVQSQRNVWRDLRHQLDEADIHVLGSRTIDKALQGDEPAW